MKKVKNGEMQDTGAGISRSERCTAKKVAVPEEVSVTFNKSE